MARDTIFELGKTHGGDNDINGASTVTLILTDEATDALTSDLYRRTSGCGAASSMDMLVAHILTGIVHRNPTLIITSENLTPKSP
jgi:hypothetical protein